MARPSRLVLMAFTLSGCVAASAGPTGVGPSPTETAAASEPADSQISKAPPTAQKTNEAATREQKASRPPTSRSQPASSGKSETQLLMKDHFREADQIRIAVIAGKLQDAVKPAHKLLYASELETLPVAWRGAVKRMQDSAQRLKGSNDMVMAAASLADIGTSCGYCHQRMGYPRIPLLLKPPSSDGSLEGHMRQHAWAMERLWEGLYVPSLDGWNAGIDLLSNAPFPDDVFVQKGMYARTAADDFTKIVAKAPRSVGPEAQAASYAALLATCATCHLATD